MTRLVIGSMFLLSVPGCGPEAFSPDADELCTALADCAPSTTHEECVAIVEPSYDQASDTGCISEANGANGCTIDILASDCMADPTASCDAEYRAYNECVAAAGGASGFACEVSSGGLHYCVEYIDTTINPESTCNALMGTLVDPCPPGEIVGSCEQTVSGTTVVQTYYGPLTAGLTAETIAGICTDQGGVWSEP